MRHKYFDCLDELWANREPPYTATSMFEVPSYVVTSGDSEYIPLPQV